MQSLLTITEYAPSYDLTVLETVKSELGISNNLQDDKLTLMIHQVSNAISTICDRTFAQETVSEVFRINSGRVGRFRSWGGSGEGVSLEGLILRRRPIISIESLIEDQVTIDSSEYEFDPGAGILYRLTNDDRRTTWLANKITVNYICGYFLLEDLPYDLEKAALIWIKYVHTRLIATGDSNLKVEETPGLMRKEYFDPLRLSLKTTNSLPAPPDEVMVLLAPYMEVAIR
jgi:hypothetical protein